MIRLSTTLQFFFLILFCFVAATGSLFVLECLIQLSTVEFSSRSRSPSCGLLCSLCCVHRAQLRSRSPCQVSFLLVLQLSNFWNRVPVTEKIQGQNGKKFRISEPKTKYCCPPRISVFSSPIAMIFKKYPFQKQTQTRTQTNSIGKAKYRFDDHSGAERCSNPRLKICANSF